MKFTVLTAKMMSPKVLQSYKFAQEALARMTGRERELFSMDKEEGIKAYAGALAQVIFAHFEDLGAFDD